MTDPEDVTRPLPADLEEVAADDEPDDRRPLPLEADPADVAEQRSDLGPDDERRDPDPGF